MNTNFSLSFYKRTRSSSFIRTRISWISRIFVRGGALTGGTHDVEHLILLNTNLTNNTNLFGTRIFLFYTHTDLTDHTLLHEIFLNTNLTNLFGTRIFLFYTHTDLTDHTDLLHEIFLNTNLTNNTNLFGTRIFLFLYAHGFHGSHGFFTRDFLNTNLTNNTNLFGMRIFLFLYAHGSHGSFCLRQFLIMGFLDF